MIRRLTAPFWEWWYRHHPSLSRFTKEEALKIARDFNLETEVIEAMKHGCNPDEALQEWDIYPYNVFSSEKSNKPYFLSTFAL